jgi:hypothetical protein
MGWIRVGITNSNVDTGTELAAIYKPGAAVPYIVDVSSGKTKLEFEFFKGVEGLTLADFTIVSGATKGSTVTDATTSHKNWALDSSGATSPIKVKITKSGVDPAEHTVTF